MTSQSDAIARRIVRRVVADLPSTSDCAFNVAKKGQHRFCSRMGRESIGGYDFCRRHAGLIIKRVLDAVSADDGLVIVSHAHDENEPCTINCQRVR